MLLADPPGQIQVELAEAASEALYSNCAATVLLTRPTFTVQTVARLY